MAHLLAGPANSAHSFEYALGLSFGVLHEEGYGDSDWDSFAAYPSSTIGYRYHPLDGGFLFRIGASINYATFGYIPLPMISAGYAF
ncbi:MAG: hypothetical protein FJ095_19795 [Deltaproteobacteria bacterium]|nr:hypothetical protein [Deltaproteobacteria bacterium]